VPTGRLNHAYPESTRSSLRSFGRGGVVLATSLAMLAFVPTAGRADPAPTIAEVTDQVDALYLEMTAAVEDYDEARVRSDEARAELATLQSNLDHLQADLDAASDEAGALAAAQYRSSGLDQTVQMLLSEDTGDFLSRVSQLDQVADRQAQTVANLDTAKDQLAEQQLAVERETTRLAELTATLEAAKDEADSKHQAAEDLLAELTAAERARVAAEQAAREAAAAAAAQRVGTGTAPATGGTADTGSTSTPTPPASGPASGRAKIAVDFALAQIGDSYVYGAAGPNSWDCSGLTMGAWGAAGVSLPHSSRAQSGMGSAVSSSALQPGDLVFYYSPISHVGIYIGNGQIVHASNPSKPVGVAPVFSMSYAGARRVG
jgi:cell wall-associated NlpC family hydrolase